MRIDIEELPDILTLQETADLFRISKQTTKKWIKSGKLPGIRINERGDWRCRRDEIKKVLGI